MSTASNKGTATLARRAGFARDLSSVALRALRLTARDKESVIPGLMVPLFFLVVNIGSLQSFVEGNLPPGFDFKGFQLPVSVIFAVTGISRAGSLVIDIQDGYLDRLLLTPVNRVTLLLGLLIGVSFETGLVGMIVFILIGTAWGLAFTGFPYAIALKTGNPIAVSNAFLLFFPFAVLTPAYVPQAQMTGWLATVADWNPVTYLLAGMRALVLEGWDWSAIGRAFLAAVLVGAVSFFLAFSSLRGRVRRG
ncbi:MAG: ABC transporter permease [Actinomycetota bacterium]